MLPGPDCYPPNFILKIVVVLELKVVIQHSLPENYGKPIPIVMINITQKNVIRRASLQSSSTASVDALTHPRAYRGPVMMWADPSD